MNSISVIIPCYNVEKYVRECVESVLRQQFQAHEIICVNDGSTDRTLHVLSELREKNPSLIKIITIKNSGGSAARNVGLKASGGNLIQFLDADDVIVPEKFKQQVKGFDEHTDMVVSDWVLKNESLTTEIKKLEFSKCEENPLETAITKIISTCNPLYKASIVKQHSGYDESLQSAQDWDFHIRLVLAGCNIKYIKGVFFIARKRNNSVSSDWVKVSIQAVKIIIRLKSQLLNSNLMNKSTGQYLSQLFMDSAIHTENKNDARIYVEELKEWAGGDHSFIRSKIKRFAILVLGIGNVIAILRITTRKKF